MGKLVDAEFETQQFGVIVNSRWGKARTWWTVPLKYSIMVLISMRNEFIDFMAETGMDLFISGERLSNGQMRVWFVADMNFTAVMDYMANMRERPTMDDQVAFSNLLYYRNDKLNEAANYAVEAKRRFQDFIRKCYYEKRMTGNYDEAVQVRQQAQVVMMDGDVPIHQFATVAAPSVWECPHAFDPNRKTFGPSCSPFEPCDLCVQDGTWKR